MINNLTSRALVFALGFACFDGCLLVGLRYLRGGHAVETEEHRTPKSHHGARDWSKGYFQQIDALMGPHLTPRQAW